MFKGTSKPLPHKLAWIKSQTEETAKAFTRARSIRALPESNSWIKLCWTPPPEGYAKINVDGSVGIEDNRASCGGVLRDSSGEWIQGFLYSIGNCSPFEAEAWAALKGIQLARHLGWKQLIIESDSEEIVNYLNNARIPTIAAHNILEACKKELQAIESCKISASARESNKVADTLAKLAKGLPIGMHILAEPPDMVKGLLEDDNTGIPSWRFALAHSDCL